MAVTYFRRFCMQIDIRGWQPQAFAPLAPGYEFLPWDEILRDSHAKAKFESFRDELDTNIFSCLGNLEGCRRLMRDISFRDGFLPESTWLLVKKTTDRKLAIPCGTIQAIRVAPRIAAIQNVGVIPSERGLGFGARLVSRALEGMCLSRIDFGQLEVTAQNVGAVRLYQRLGFSRLKVVYKSADIRLFPAAV